MSAAAIVTILDLLTNRESRTLLGESDPPVVELGLEGGEERLGHGINPAHAGVAHGARDDENHGNSPESIIAYSDEVADFGGFRTPVPIESGHPFRGFRTP